VTVTDVLGPEEETRHSFTHNRNCGLTRSVRLIKDAPLEQGDRHGVKVSVTGLYEFHRTLFGLRVLTEGNYTMCSASLQGKHVDCCDLANTGQLSQPAEVLSVSLVPGAN